MQIPSIISNQDFSRKLIQTSLGGGMSNNSVQTEEAVLSRQENYAELLKNYGLSYQEVFPYLQVGEITRIQGWILHLSVIASQTQDLLQKVIPILVAEKIPFKIPANSQITDSLLAGNLGYQKLGKIICIYPETDQQVVTITRQLIVITAGKSGIPEGNISAQKAYRGPAIPTDRHLGGCVYTRYGGFKPVFLTNEDGQTEPYITDDRGNTIKDDYFIPFRLPKGISWPFEEFAAPDGPKAGRLLNDRYLPVQTLKNDVKGKVIKALDLKSWWHIRWCIIKQGNKYMSADAAGRDSKDRLLWQYAIHKDLEDKIPLPKVYDYFEINGDAYLVMEYIEGPSLSEKVTNLYNGNGWQDLSYEKQLVLIDYFLQVTTLVGDMHHAGYVHRDLSPANFLVNKDNRLVAIDVELAYSLKKALPSPAFALGTPGFMSPEQMATRIPAVKEDFYGLGGLLIKCLTGLSPTKFSTHNQKRLTENLTYFTGNQQIAGLISSCLHSLEAVRPGLAQIQTAVKNFRQTLSSEKISGSQTTGNLEGNTETVINQALLSFSNGRLTNQEGLWFSKTLQPQNSIANEVKENTFYPGLHEGISGVLYTLAQASLAGYDLSGCKEVLNKNRNYLQENYLNKAQQVPPGLFNGNYSLALVTSSLLQSGIIRPDEKLILQMTECLTIFPGTDLNLATGIAGQGLSVLHCLPWLEANDAEKILQQCVTQLLDRQEKDGSWKQTKTGIQEKGIKLPGFSYGIAGITYFLLEYAVRFNSEPAKCAAVKALDWLIRQRHRKNDFRIWYVNPHTKTEDPWLDHGFSGITLVFIKAFELLKDSRYKAVVDSALLIHPEKISANYLMLSSGITGLGEIYLEAYRVFKENTWLKRAGWIAGFLVHTALEQPDGSVYWLADYDTNPTADLMVGNSGLIHFLMRYQHPDVLGFPLFGLK